MTRIKFIEGNLDEIIDINNDPWNDIDDYYYEDNNSDKLLIIFGSNGRINNKIPSFNFYNMLKKYSSFEKREF